MEIIKLKESNADSPLPSPCRKELSDCQACFGVKSRLVLLPESCVTYEEMLRALGSLSWRREDNLGRTRQQLFNT